LSMVWVKITHQISAPANRKKGYSHVTLCYSLRNCPLP